MDEDQKTTAARDGCVVDGEPLAGILSGFVTRWNRQRPADVARAGGSSSNVGPIEWLAAETGISERTIANVAKGTYQTTELRIADALVAALGCPEVFHDGTLQIRGNPLARKEERDRCCGGSEA